MTFPHTVGTLNFPQDKILTKQNWPLQILQKRLQTKWDLTFTIDELFDDYTSDEKGINDIFRLCIGQSD